MKRLWNKIERGTPTECWCWNGAMVSKKNPAMKINGKLMYVRRLVWTLLVGEIPEGCDDVKTIRRSRLPTKVLAALFRIDPGNVRRIQGGELRANVV